MVLQLNVLAVDDPADATDSRSAVLSVRTPFLLQEGKIPRSMTETNEIAVDRAGTPAEHAAQRARPILLPQKTSR